jgi:hypothetical protein
MQELAEFVGRDSGYCVIHASGWLDVHHRICYKQQTGFRLPLVSALLGLAVFGTFILNNAESRL